jgi:hypothetical protein
MFYAFLITVTFQLLNYSEDLEAIYELASILHIELDEDGYPIYRLDVDNLESLILTELAIHRIESILQEADDLGGDCPPLCDILDMKSKLIIE